MSRQSQMSATNSFAIVNCFYTIATAAKSNSVMEPPQPPDIETPFERIMEAMNHNARAPFQPFDKTKQGRNNEKKFSTALFNEFAAIQRRPLLDEYTLESIQQKDANGKLVIHTIFQEYASFVKEQKRSRGNTNALLSPKYMHKLFATPKVILSLKFVDLPILMKDHPSNKWWEKLYDDFKFDTCVACLDRGEEIETATLGIHYHQLCEIADGLIKLGTGKDIEAYAALAFQRQACGRPGETGLMNLASCQWDNGLDVAWGNRKQGRQQRISFFPDNRGFCWTHIRHLDACWWQILDII
jgi:hypothetical protein